MSEPAFVGVDWGTTNRRAWLLDLESVQLAAWRALSRVFTNER